jgi:hypothetical protein
VLNIAAPLNFSRRVSSTWDIIPMRSLSETEFWFVAAGVALSPMIILWIADGIRWFLRRTLWPCPEAEPQSGREPASNEPAGVSG